MDIIQGLIGTGNAGKSGWKIVNNKGAFGVVNKRTSNVSYSILNSGTIGTGATFVNTYNSTSSPTPSITATPSATTTGTTGNYTYQVFTYTTETAGAGTGQSLYTINVPSEGVVCDVLVVGGGGNGGNGENANRGAGGGGAGGLIYIQGVSLIGTYTITVGKNEKNSSITTTATNQININGNLLTTLIATAGGRGGTTSASGAVNGIGGGSGGGGADWNGVGANSTQNTYFGTGFGFKGGNSSGMGYGDGGAGAGGGGAGGIGSNQDGYTRGLGGPGKIIDITGTQIEYAVGGNGSTIWSNNGVNGINNRGNGGAGAGRDNLTGGTGGTGIVIIRYLTASTSSSIALIQEPNLNVITNYVGGVTSSSSGGGSSQWTTITGSKIYYNGGNVGIGTIDPIAPLHIYNNTTTATLPTEIVVAGATSATISGTTDRVISFPYSGSGTTKDYTFTTTENLICDILIVGGGGAGGMQIGAGGGGGAVLYGTNINIPIGNYTIKVGKGAVPGEVRGGSSEAFGAIILGGGSSVNAVWATTNNSPNGNSGGSGGGGKGVQAGGTPGVGGTAGTSTKGTLLNSSTLYNGNIGGFGQSQAAGVASGGGGGAGSVGGNGYDTKSGGNGGVGVPINITGTQYYWGAGGGAGCHEGIPGNGGLGGGGAGSTLNSTIGTYTGDVGGSGYGIASGKHAGNGTGSGGGGVHVQDNVGGNGGSGIIIIRYRKQTQLSVSNARLLLDATTTGTTAIEFRRGTGGDAQNDFRIINDTNSSLKLQCENSTQVFGNTVADLVWFSSNETIIHKNTTMNGRVGIGTMYNTTIPSRTLDVVGDANISGVMSVGSLSASSATITNSSSSNVSLTIQNEFVSLPNEIVVTGTTFGTIGATDRYIQFPYSGTGATKDYTFTTTENLICDILIVGGGGCGGRSGGGGGTVLYTQNVYSPVGSYTVKVGNGGISIKTGGVGNTQGANGTDSEILFGSTTIFRAKGGGLGAANGAGVVTGGTGGSGGGSEHSGSVSSVSSANIISTNISSSSFTTTTSAPNGTTIRGNVGGLGAIKLPNYYYYVGGGGGGAGGTGGNGNTTNNTSGAGGSGINIDITGTNIMYGSGGSGGVYNDYTQGNVPATPGNVTDGGGTGAYNINSISYYGSIPTPGRGGGGGGWGVNVQTGEQLYAKDGGSGIIIIRYRKLTTASSTSLELTSSSSTSIIEPIAKGIKQYPETPSTNADSWTDNGFTVTCKTSDAILSPQNTFYLFNNLIASPDHYHGAQLFNGFSPFNYTSSTSFKGANGIVLYIDLGRSITPRNMRIAPRDNASHPTLNFLAAAPGIFKIYASNDSASWTSTTHASWTEIHSQTTSLTFNYNQFTSFGNFSSITTPYRYFAMVVYNLSGNYSYLTFSEWDIFGTYDMTPVVINSDYKYLSFTYNSTVVEQKTGVSGWRLVRFLPPTATAWHPINDNLAGTTTYGTAYNYTNAWSIPFGTFDEFVFGTLNLQYWMRITKTAAIGATYDGANRNIISSSFSSTPYTALQYYRVGNPEDPWMSIKDHGTGGAAAQIVYGENATTANTPLLTVDGGMGVWVRNSAEAQATLPSQTSYTVNFPESTLCDILVVGGGGGGGNDRGGGGGGGGVIYSQNITLNGTYTIMVGKEGVGTTSGTGGGTGTRGTNGSNSSISGSNITTITAIGGGGGGACASGVIRDGLSGGSGGGGSQFNGAGSGGTGTSGQGRNGGIGFESGAGGGGGGAVNVGNDANSTNAGNGGLGLSNTITNSAVIYGSGGGGGGTSPLSFGGSIKLPGTGGSSGAGNGGGVNVSGVNATIYGCGGGGGGLANGSVTTGGKGFAGIVIIRYKSTKSGNQTYKVGNFNGEFKVISSVSNTDTDYIKITTAGAITNPTGTASWNTGSDRRIKENIERASYDKCFENINRLELNRFNYVSGFNTVNRDRTQLGFIAQEVKDIFPKSISSQEYYSNTLNIPDLLSIDITQINYSLYGAVKKLIEINIEKDIRIITLNNRIKILKNLLNITDDAYTSNIVLGDDSGITITDNNTSNLVIDADTSNIVADTIVIDADTSNIVADTIVIDADTSNILADTIVIDADTSNIVANTIVIDANTSNIVANTIVIDANTSNIASNE